MATIKIQYKTLPDDDWQEQDIEVGDGQTIETQVLEELGSVFYKEAE